MRIKYAIATLAVGGSLAASAFANAEPASAADPTAQMSFNLQYLQLQSQMQKENRSYAALSNINKALAVQQAQVIANMRP